jgi:hypothetical protein
MFTRAGCPWFQSGALAAMSLFTECFNCRDDVQQFGCNRGLTQLPGFAGQGVQTIVDVAFSDLHGSQPAGVFAGQRFGARGFPIAPPHALRGRSAIALDAGSSPCEGRGKHTRPRDRERCEDPSRWCDCIAPPPHARTCRMLTPASVFMVFTTDCSSSVTAMVCFRASTDCTQSPPRSVSCLPPGLTAIGGVLLLQPCVKRLEIFQHRRGIEVVLASHLLESDLPWL